MDHKKLIKAIEKATGKKGVPVTVKMKGRREVSKFLRNFRKAQEVTRKSRSTERYGINHYRANVPA